jgi:signal transduction histidine kinase
MTIPPTLAAMLVEHLPVPVFLHNGDGLQPLNSLARSQAARGLAPAQMAGAWSLETADGRLVVPGLDPEERRHAEQLQSFGRYTGGIVHNLNNPLNALSGMIQLMMFRNSDLPELERLDHQTDELAKLIRHLGDRYRRLLEYERGTPLSWELVVEEELRFHRADSALKHRCQLEKELPADIACPLTFRDASWLVDRLLEAILKLVPGEGMCPLRVDLKDGWPRLRLEEPDIQREGQALQVLGHPLLTELLDVHGLELRWNAGAVAAEVAVAPRQA